MDSKADFKEGGLQWSLELYKSIVMRSYLTSYTVAVITHPLRLVLQELLGAHEAVPEEVLRLPMLVPHHPGLGFDPLTGLDTLGADPVITHDLHSRPWQLILGPTIYDSNSKT